MRMASLVIFPLLFALLLWLTSQWLRSFSHDTGVYLRWPIARGFHINWWEGNISFLYGSWEFATPESQAAWREAMVGSQAIAPSQWRLSAASDGAYPPAFEAPWVGFGWQRYTDPGFPPPPGSSYHGFAIMSPGWLPPLVLAICCGPMLIRTIRWFRGPHTTRPAQGQDATGS